MTGFRGVDLGDILADVGRRLQKLERSLAAPPTPKLEELPNVGGGIPHTGDVLTYDFTTQRWKPGAAGGLRYATVVVAASNSLHPSAADFVCTGTNDEATVQAAVDSIPSGLGGTVLLMEGDYHFDTVGVSSSTNFDIDIAGLGNGNANLLGTIIHMGDIGLGFQEFNCVSNLLIYMDPSTTLTGVISSSSYNLQVQATSAIPTPLCTGVQAAGPRGGGVRSCHFAGVNGVLLHDDCEITGCFFESCLVGITIDNHSSSAKALIHGNRYTCTTAIKFRDTDNTNILIYGEFVDAGAVIIDGDHNTFRDSVAKGGITVNTGATANRVLGNDLRGSTFTDNGTGTVTAVGANGQIA